MKGYLQVGAVTNTHALKGEVKVYPLTDDVKRYDDLKQKEVRLVFENGRKTLDLEVEKVRYFKNLVIVKFKGLDNISDVEGFKGGKLFVSRENAVPLGEDEYYECDLIGMEVFQEDGSLLGELKEVIHTGANDVYDVTLSGGGRVLIPAIRQCILEVNVEEGRMRVHLLEGLM